MKQVKIVVMVYMGCIEKITSNVAPLEVIIEDVDPTFNDPDDTIKMPNGEQAIVSHWDPDDIAYNPQGVGEKFRFYKEKGVGNGEAIHNP